MQYKMYSYERHGSFKTMLVSADALENNPAEDFIARPDDITNLECCGDVDIDESDVNAPMPDCFIGE